LLCRISRRVAPQEYFHLYSRIRSLQIRSKTGTASSYER